MMEIAVPLVIIALLIILNGAFVAAEFAIIGAPRSAMEARSSHDRAARRVSEIQRNPRNQDRYIATAQIGITFASLGLGMYGEHIVASWFAGGLERLGPADWIASHGVAIALAVGTLTYFHIVFGEMVPKSLALQQAERTALSVTPFMILVKFALYPLVIGLNGAGNGVLRLLGINRQTASAEQRYSPEELEYMIRESARGGRLGSESARILQALLDFGDRTAEEMMVPRVKVHAIRLGATPDELAELVKRAPHTRYPVYDSDLDHIAGMLPVQTALQLLESQRPLAPADVEEIRYVPAPARIDAVLASMRSGAAEMVAVLDEYGGTAGIVTMEDVFEELIGEVEESPATRRGLRRTDGRGVVVPGTMRLDEVGDRIGIVLGHDEVYSVNGLLQFLLNRPPTPGDVVNYNGASFRVLSVEGHAAQECVVERQ